MNVKVTGGGVWNRSRSAGGVWDPAAFQVDINGKIFDTYTAALPDNSLHVGTLVNVG